MSVIGYLANRAGILPDKQHEQEQAATAVAAGGSYSPYVGLALAGGYANSQGQKDANERSSKHAQAERDQQIEFAKHGIEWKVEDARRAGVSKLAALGASTSSYQPSQISYGNENSGIVDAGQNISDSIFRNIVQNQQMRGTDLDNDLKMAQIGKLEAETRALINPTMDRDNNQTSTTSQTAPQTQWVDIGNNVYQDQLTVEAASRLQDDLPARLGYQIKRAFGNNPPPADRLPFPFTRWEPEGFAGQYRAVNPDPENYIKFNPKGVPKNYKFKKYGPIIPYRKPNAL